MERDDPESWSRHFGSVHRALSDPAAVDELPRVSQCEAIDEFQAYWEALDYLLRALVGWQNVGAGLAWWYERGKDIGEDPRFELINQVWDEEGQLDYYAAHYWRAGQVFLEPEDMSPSEMSRQSAWGSEDWWRQLKRQGRRFRHDPYYGGGNPLHLGDNQHFGWLSDQGPVLGFPKDGDHGDMKAVLVVSGLRSWRVELEAFGKTLKPHPHASWHVEVFDRRIGFLGLFRQSRVTGRWFQGKHSVHMAGNPASDSP